jgi:lipid-A-disaccharide synthase
MISAGEASGDLHGASLIREAGKTAPHLEFFGLGGDSMAKEGFRLEAHLRDTAVMGLTEVIGALPRILKLGRRLRDLLQKSRPSALVLIDSPDFNFPLAKAAKMAGIPVIYYICPQIWAWRAGRLKFLARFTDRRALILPFEAPYYRERGLSADFVGHPLLDRIKGPLESEEKKVSLRRSLGLPASGPILAILPGSRQPTARRLMAPMLEAAAILARSHPDLSLAIPRAGSLRPDFMEALLKKAPPEAAQRLRLLEGHSQELLSVSQAALLASGTSAVEGAILGTPMAVTYRVSPLSWFLAKRLIKIPCVSLPNLVSGRPIVPELLQGQGSPENLARALRPYLEKGPEREAALEDLASFRQALGGEGASGRVISIILEEIARNEGRNRPQRLKGQIQPALED